MSVSGARCLLRLRCFSQRALLARFLAVGGRRQLSQETSGLGTEEEDEREQSRQQAESQEADHQLRERILRASLPFVPQHGWTSKTLAAGAEAEGLPPIAHGMFPRGGAELIHFLYRDCNARLAAQLAEEVQQLQQQGQEKPPTSEFIRNALEKRLRMIVPYKEQWPQAMAIQTLPQNAPEAWRNLASLCDDVWYYAGDRSADFNWYTKRVSLAGVYKSTEIYLVQDDSEDLQETWHFLERRMQDLVSLGKAARNSQQMASAMAEGVQGALIMMRNVLGMNARNR